VAGIDDAAAAEDGAAATVLLGRYRLSGALGRGGMATVFRAWDAKLGREVAVKVFRAGEGVGEDLERQRREIRLLASASHPHLVTLLDAEWPRHAEDVETPGFLVMELVDGESLRRVIDRLGGDGALARRLLCELSDALASLHRGGIVHRDLKPENVLVDGASGSLKLADFGIAQLIGEEPITRAGTVLGTAAYLSPEQLGGGAIGPQADVYALGLVALETITGQRVFPGGSVESALARLSRDPWIPEELPGPWRELLRAMTARDPAERPTSAAVALAAQQLPELPAARIPAEIAADDATQAMPAPGWLDATEALTAAAMAAPAAAAPAVAAPPAPSADTAETEPLAAARPRRARRLLAEGGAVLLVAAASAAVALALSQGRPSGAATDPAGPATPVPTVTETLVPRPAATQSSEPVTPVQDATPVNTGVTGSGAGSGSGTTGGGAPAPAPGPGHAPAPGHGPAKGPGAGPGGGKPKPNH
jgi:hypothetical protein